MREMITMEDPEQVRRSRYSSKTGHLEAVVQYYQIAVFVLGFVVLAQACWSYAIYRRTLTRQPLVVGINSETGDVYALKPEAIAVRPGESFIRHVLADVVRWRTERRAGRLEDYERALMFFDSSLTTEQATAADRKEFVDVVQGKVPETLVDVKSVMIHTVTAKCEDVRSPCRAHVTLVKSQGNRGGLSESHDYTAEVSFVLTPVTESMWRVNPLGIVITDFRQFEGVGR